jgi:hypothetical protein
MGANWYLLRIDMSLQGTQSNYLLPLSTTGGHCTHFVEYVNRIRHDIGFGMKNGCFRVERQGYSLPDEVPAWPRSVNGAALHPRVQYPAA